MTSELRARVRAIRSNDSSGVCELEVFMTFSVQGSAGSVPATSGLNCTTGATL
jgi:hypothetical protein